MENTDEFPDEPGVPALFAGTFGVPGPPPAPTVTV
jgi:hypothetical protein